MESDTLTQIQPELAEAVLKTIVTDLSAPNLWPFTSDESTAEWKTYADIEYLAPRHDSGSYVSVAAGYCVTNECSPYGITLFSSRSILHVNAETGTVNSSTIHPDDSEAFARFLDCVKVIPDQP